jgi:hypothetical protein
MSPLGKPCKFASMSFIQGDIDALRIGSHGLRIAQIYTARVG